MPADDRYDVVHALTVAGEHYGCHNRAEFKDSYLVPNGYASALKDTVRIKLKRIPAGFTTNCQHTDAETDARCAGCFRVGEAKKLGE